MIALIHRGLVMAVVLLLHFCSPTPVLNALAPEQGISLTSGLAYGAGSRQSVDIYAPSATGPPAPVIVFFYGGGWQEGSRTWYAFVGRALAARGLVVAIPDYRLYPQARFPAFMEDAAQAVAWVRANAGRFGGDPHRLFLMGHSAGGQIAALLALDPAYLGAVNLSPADVCGLIGLAGAYDYTPGDPTQFAEIFGAPANWPAARPINYVTARAPPMLLLSGRADSVIEPGNTLRLAGLLNAAEVPVTTWIYPDITHGAILAALSDELSFLAPVGVDALDFIGAHPACRR